LETVTLQQQQLRDEVAHNTDLTQQNWGMTTSIQTDMHGFFDYMHYDPNQYYQ
jgi:hypothetical protein